MPWTGFGPFSEVLASNERPIPNLAVSGSSGAGKSMLVGALLLATGAISERDLAKRRKAEFGFNAQALVHWLEWELAESLPGGRALER